MKRERRHFDKEFKMMAVNLCLTGKPTQEIANELGVRSELVRRWKREYEEYREGSFSGHGNANMSTEQKEIFQLKKALKDAQIERDILKKAISIFSRGDDRYSNS
jgi:transposase